MPAHLMLCEALWCQNGSEGAITKASRALSTVLSVDTARAEAAGLLHLEL